MSHASLAARDATPWNRLVPLWLYGIAALVFVMVTVGGATRLTDSGLSITEWQPLLGVVPPLNEGQWQEAFGKYQAIPEYRLVNRGMSLAEFKVIYWWEWSHRFLGRLIGLAFLLPLLAFWVAGAIPRRRMPWLLGIFALGAAQGALGWFMVQSGLSERVDVSQYRLSAHLTIAAVIFAAILWTAFGWRGGNRSEGRSAVPATLLVGLVMLQIAVGGFVAGLDAGMGYNTWPLIDGALVPPGLGAIEPWWRNLFENALTVQFEHRLLAYLLTAAAAVNLAYASEGLRTSAGLLMTVVLLQAAGGVWTLLARVPIGLGLMHQAGAMLVLAAAVWHLHQAVRSAIPSPGRGRQ